MDWVPIDYGEVFNKRRPFPNQNGMARVLEAGLPPEKQVEKAYDLEITGEISNTKSHKCPRWISNLCPKD
jgi:hypothetical protein